MCRVGGEVVRQTRPGEGRRNGALLVAFKRPCARDERRVDCVAVGEAAVTSGLVEPRFGLNRWRERGFDMKANTETVLCM